MSEKNNIFENDLLMRDILESGREEVPAHVWDAVSERLDKAAGVQTGKTVTLWWRRAGVAVAAMAAAVAAVLIVNRPQTIDIIPTDATGDMIAVVEHKDMTECPETIGESAPETEAGEVTLAKKARKAEKMMAYTAKPIEVEAPEAETIEEYIETVVPDVPKEAEVKEETKVKEVADVKPENVVEDIYFPQEWKEEDDQNRRVKTSVVVSGITGGAASSNIPKAGVFKAPTLLLTPSETGVTESRSKQTFGLPVSVGAGFRFELTKRWSVGLGLNYTLLTRSFDGTYTKLNEQGGVEKYFDSAIRNNQHYIGLPVNVYFNILNSKNINFYTYAGGAIEKCLTDKYLVLSENIVHKESVPGVQLSADIGLGAEFMLTKALGLYIDPSLRYYFDCEQPKSLRTIQPFMFGVELGFRFKL